MLIKNSLYDFLAKGRQYLITIYYRYKLEFFFCILGESGSGKTEAARIVLQFIVLVSGDSPPVKLIKDRLVQAGALLEAFGNARTIRNDNASRFVSIS